MSNKQLRFAWGGGSPQANPQAFYADLEQLNKCYSNISIPTIAQCDVEGGHQ